MVEPKREKWHEIVKKVEAIGVDGLELNFGCPHGMAERGMGAASGQQPDLVETQTMWVKEAASTPVIVKLTPNITDITATGEAAARGGADAISLINTINSLAGVDIDTWNTVPHVGGKGSHGGYCGPAVKPIALNMVAECAGIPSQCAHFRDRRHLQLERYCGIYVHGRSNVQVCTAAMHHGFRIVEEMIVRSQRLFGHKGIASVTELTGRSVPRYAGWGHLDLNYKVVAKINTETCISCNKCHIACEQTAHQCIDRKPMRRESLISR